MKDSKFISKENTLIFGDGRDLIEITNDNKCSINPNYLVPHNGGKGDYYQWELIKDELNISVSNTNTTFNLSDYIEVEPEYKICGIESYPVVFSNCDNKSDNFIIVINLKKNVIFVFYHLKNDSFILNVLPRNNIIIQSLRFKENGVIELYGCKNRCYDPFSYNFESELAVFNYDLFSNSIQEVDVESEFLPKDKFLKFKKNIIRSKFLNTKFIFDVVEDELNSFMITGCSEFDDTNKEVALYSCDCPEMRYCHGFNIVEYLNKDKFDIKSILDMKGSYCGMVNNEREKYIFYYRYDESKFYYISSIKMKERNEIIIRDLHKLITEEYQLESIYITGGDKIVGIITVVGIESENKKFHIYIVPGDTFSCWSILSYIKEPYRSISKVIM